MILHAVIIGALFCVSMALGEIAHRLNTPNYFARNITHIAGSIIALLLPYWMSINTVIISGFAFILILTISKQLGLFVWLFQGEYYMKTKSPQFFVLGLMIAAITFWNFEPYVYQMCCLILGFSDALAAVVGKLYGKIKFQIGVEKTIEGSITFFTVTVLLMLFLLPIYNLGITGDRFSKSIVSSLFLTCVEAVFGDGWDNLMLPIVSGYLSVWVFF